jgi:hypothetical protein|tara:strand:+ start:543 stop:785 length:243 start_codon:yes stop_codon:yes gene_type:complete
MAEIIITQKDIINHEPTVNPSIPGHQFTYEVSGSVDGKEFMMEWVEENSGNHVKFWMVGEELFEGESGIWGEFGEAMDKY